MCAVYTNPFENPFENPFDLSPFKSDHLHVIHTYYANERGMSQTFRMGEICDTTAWSSLTVKNIIKYMTSITNCC